MDDKEIVRLIRWLVLQCSVRSYLKGRWSRLNEAEDLLKEYKEIRGIK